MLIVKKFGGTSVANKERIFNVANRCIEEYRKGNDVVVVLSAMGKYNSEPRGACPRTPRLPAISC